MKKYSEIQESLFSDVVNRGEGRSERKEDVTTNITELKPVDMGCSVLWADKDLKEHNGNSLFSFDEACEMINPKYGWRLPTKEEVADLAEKKTKLSNETDCYKLTGRGTLIFPKTGIIYRTCTRFGPMDKQLYYAWTGDDCNNGSSAHIFMFENSSFIHTPRNSKSPFDFVCKDKEDKICVRLVKDK